MACNKVEWAPQAVAVGRFSAQAVGTVGYNRVLGAVEQTVWRDHGLETQWDVTVQGAQVRRTIWDGEPEKAPVWGDACR